MICCKSSQKYLPRCIKSGQEFIKDEQHVLWKLKLLVTVLIVTITS